MVNEMKIRSKLRTVIKKRSLMSEAKNSIYTFSRSDKSIGAEINLIGYSDKYNENIIDSKRGFINVTVGDSETWVPKDHFRTGELSYIYNEIFTSYKWNPHAYVNKSLSVIRGDYVIDVGACEGFFIKYALQLGAKKVMALEPLAEIAKGLHLTYKSEVDNESVEIINKGLSDQEQIIQFDHGNEFLSEAKMNPNGDEKCKVIPLDKVMEKKIIPKVDFIKMDIEGAEILAIKGSQNTIEQFKPKISVAVYHSYENANILKDMLIQYRPDYKIVFGGCYTYEKPFRPYMLYAY